MDTEEIAKKLKEEKQVIFSDEINYKGKQYVKTIKLLEKKIEYLYYEIENGNIGEVEDRELLEYFKKMYEIKEKDKSYQGK